MGRIRAPVCLGRHSGSATRLPVVQIEKESCATVCCCIRRACRADARVRGTPVPAPAPRQASPMSVRVRGKDGQIASAGGISRMPERAVLLVDARSIAQVLRPAAVGPQGEAVFPRLLSGGRKRGPRGLVLSRQDQQRPPAQKPGLRGCRRVPRQHSGSAVAVSCGPVEYVDRVISPTRWPCREQRRASSRGGDVGRH